MKYVVGIDEVGRGPLAGPVTVGVVICTQKNYLLLKKNKLLPNAGRDSKKLSAAYRAHYSKILKQLHQSRSLSFSVVHVSNRHIDAVGISTCIQRAITTGLLKLKVSKDSLILLDGGLKAPPVFKQKTIIKGDEREKIIAWASIVAKVSRDNLMTSYSKKYPQYDFHIHKGYGTVDHRRRIKAYGPSPIHRLTWIKP